MIKKIFGVFFASWLCISPSFLYAKEEQVKLHVEVDGPGTIWIDDQRVQIGRASCRERVCQYV